MGGVCNLEVKKIECQNSQYIEEINQFQDIAKQKNDCRL